MKIISKIAFIAGITLLAHGAFAQKMSSEKTVVVGGAPMYPSKNIIENAVNSKDHTTLITLVNSADLAETLQTVGPFTVFAPTNAAFDKLPKGTIESLLKVENKSKLSGILTYHVISGKFDSKEIMAMIEKGGGKAALKTINGGILTASVKGGKLMLTDEKGGTAIVTIKDVYQSNGVIHVIDSVVMPG